jgi:hypothetical protein
LQHPLFLMVYRQSSILFLFHCCTDSSTFCAWAAWSCQYILEEIYYICQDRAKCGNNQDFVQSRAFIAAKVR